MNEEPRMRAERDSIFERMDMRDYFASEFVKALIRARTDERIAEGMTPVVFAREEREELMADAFDMANLFLERRSKNKDAFIRRHQNGGAI